MMQLAVIAACCTIGGNVHTVGGAALTGVRLELRGTVTVSARTDAQGNFTILAEPGTYELAIAERGYTGVTVQIQADHDVPVQIALESLDSPQIRRIGQVTVDGRLAPIAGTVPSVVLSRDALDRLGSDRIVDGLAQVPGATFSRPDGGNSAAVAVVSLRGPDPSESLLALDGQLLNDGNTGDLDLSRLPVAAFAAVDVSEGLGPQDTNGSNTFGGAIDLISLRPTAEPHVAAALSTGSFGQSDAWLNLSGRRGRLGYAGALDTEHEAGYVNETVPLYSTNDPNCAPCATRVGSAIAARLALGTLTWTFANTADVTVRLLSLGDTRDQSAAVNAIDRNAADSASPAFGQLTGPGNQTFAQVIRAYQLRARAPFGAGELSAELSTSNNSVDVDGGSASPYDIVHRDRRTNAALTWQRNFTQSQFAFGGYARAEQLDFPAPAALNSPARTDTQEAAAIGQAINVVFARGEIAATSKLRLDGAVFASHYSTFGANLDGRLGAIYTLDGATAVRFSLGSGFRAPLLAERYVFAYDALPLDANNVFTGQGSVTERPEHATEYELGLSRELSKRATLDMSLYRTNLRSPVEVDYPLGAVAAGTCRANTYAKPLAACVSFVSNVGNAVYTGAEIRLSQNLSRRLFVRAMYGLNVAYPRDLSAAFSNPTSGGNLVSNAQFEGIPQQQGSLALDWRNAGWRVAATAVARGDNNELHLAPFTNLDASVGKQLAGGLDLAVAARNVLNAGAGRFTILGGGTPYRGLVDRSPQGAPMYGALPTNAEFVEPLALRVILTLRR